MSRSYDHIDSTSGWQLLYVTVCFAVQIYCDFAGYTHIAIGCARLLGIELMRNFAYPYFSRSIPEFWGRWHISLTRWFREYVYLPLGGNRVTYRRWLLNILIVFLVSGFWHGANWTFVVWGLLHGVLYLAYSLAWPESQRLAAATPGGDSVIPSAGSVLQIALTFSLTCLAWVFFRAASVADGLAIVTKIVTDVATTAPAFTYKQAAIWIVVLFGIEWVQRHHANPLHLERSHGRSGGASTTRSRPSSSCSRRSTTRRSSISSSDHCDPFSGTLAIFLNSAGAAAAARRGRASGGVRRSVAGQPGLRLSASASGFTLPARH